MKPQVLIVGAGPVGLTMAIELARYGLQVRIVDKAAERTDKSKALVIWSRTLELLERSDLAKTIVDAGWRIQGANIVAGDETIGHIDLTTVKSRYDFAITLPQSETERILEEHLSGLGVKVERQVEVAGFSLLENSVSTQIRHAAGEAETVESDWIVGCDGAHSVVRHTLGLPFDGDTMTTDWILADLHVEGYPFPASEIAVYWHHEGILAVFPISSGRFRIIGDIGLSSGDLPLSPTLDAVQAVVDKRSAGKMRVSDPIWLSSFRINERKVADYSSGRAFVVGDAAHVHSPAGGQGMNTGMQDAINLAWKLALVSRNSVSVTILDSYSVERSAVGEEVLKAAGRLTKLAVLRNHVVQEVRDVVAHTVLGLAPVRQKLVDAMSEITIGYGSSPLNGRHALGLHPAPGDRMAPVDGQTPVGSSPRFALFGPSSAEASGLLDRYPDLVEPELRTPPVDSGTWLVRPDGYVACTSKNDDLKTIADYLEALL